MALSCSSLSSSARTFASACAAFCSARAICSSSERGAAFLSRLGLLFFLPLGVEMFHLQSEFRHLFLVQLLHCESQQGRGDGRHRVLERETQINAVCLQLPRMNRELCVLCVR